MITKDLSRLLLPKAGDLSGLQLTIIDEERGKPRPCTSDEEVLKATNIKELIYMTPPDVERQIHLRKLVYDEAVLSGIDIDKYRDINDKSMGKMVPNYSNLDGGGG